MKKTFTFLFNAVLLLTCFSVSAQNETKKWSLDFGLEGGLPVGDIQNSYHFDGGLTLRFSYKAGPGFATFTTGLIAFDPKKVTGVKEKAALRHDTGPWVEGWRKVFAPEG